jgi:probable rRNA maturation factor
LKMTISVDLQNDAGLPGVPGQKLFFRWVESSLQQSFAEFEQTIRIVDAVESESLNRQFRGKEHATNVLSFPSDSDLLDYDCIGDLVICAPVVLDEADKQNKAVESHWAHMVVHGMLHLQGFDHQDDNEAGQMEALEIQILSTLGYSNPYNENYD